MRTEDFRAVVVGATGLVGSEITRQLLADARCREVTVLARRATGVAHAKLREHVIDFARPDAWREHVRGDVLFSALGTTKKAAGSREAQYEVDYTYQRRVAEAAAANGVGTCVVISSAGADPGSVVFYTRMKGELDRDVAALGFERVVIVRPGLLAGDRAEKRAGEAFAQALATRLPAWRALAAARAYPADVVARASIRAALEPGSGARVVALHDVFALGER